MAPATHHDYDAQLAHLERLADLLDTRWRIPGLGIPIGIDGIASIHPSWATALRVVSAYLVYQASRLGVSKSVLLRMAGNVGLDWVVGSSRTIFDIGFKANRRNVNLLRRHLERERDQNPALHPNLRRV